MDAQWRREPLVLASGSPRRRELLSLLGIAYEVIPSQAEETVEGDGPARVSALALRKCKDVADRLPSRVVLAADTLVCVNDQVLGKPTDEDDAVRMLKLLSGKTHEVHTGVCLIAPGLTLRETCATRVHFVPLDDETIRRYVLTGEPMDKAGAYAIQGRAGAFVDSIQGSPTNVIGLPMEAVARLLARLGLPLFGQGIYE